MLLLCPYTPHYSILIHLLILSFYISIFYPFIFRCSIHMHSILSNPCVFLLLSLVAFPHSIFMHMLLYPSVLFSCVYVDGGECKHQDNTGEFFATVRMRMGF